MAQQALLVRGHAVADLGIDLWGRALERVDVVELGRRYRVTDPVEKLDGRHNPD